MEENKNTGYQQALAKIENARIKESAEIDLSGLSLTEIPEEISNLTPSLIKKKQLDKQYIEKKE